MDASAVFISINCIATHTMLEQRIRAGTRIGRPPGVDGLGEALVQMLERPSRQQPRPKPNTEAGAQQ